MTTITGACAWCGKDMGSKPGEGQEGISHGICEEMAEARHKAWDSLGRYKFVMFGYWAGVWVHLNRMLPTPQRNPWKELVREARKQSMRGQ